MLALTAATGRGATSIPVPGGFRSIALVAGGSAAVTPPRQPLHTGNTQPRNCSHQMSSFTPMGAQTRWSSSRAATSLRRQHDDYYKVLKLKQSATQKEIKSAYYKRSLRFHPDHNPDCNHAAEQYRAVTTAYEVLSQEHLRLRYDQTMQTGGGPTRRAVDPRMQQYRGTSAFESDQAKYDYQMWYTEHYGNELKQEQQRRRRREAKAREIHPAVPDSQSSRFAEFAVSLVAVGIMAYLLKKG